MGKPHFFRLKGTRQTKSQREQLIRLCVEGWALERVELVLHAAEVEVVEEKEEAIKKAKAEQAS
jgi:hypothetical protein